MPKKKTVKEVKKTVKKEPKKEPKVVKKSAIDLYLELEEQMKIAFKKLSEKLSVSDLKKLADKSRVQKEFACSKLIRSDNVDDLITVVKRSFDYRQEAAQKVLDRAEDKEAVSDDDLRTLIQKNACKIQASYILEERKKAKRLKRINE